MTHFLLSFANETICPTNSPESVDTLVAILPSSVDLDTILNSLDVSTDEFKIRLKDFIIDPISMPNSSLLAKLIAQDKSLFLDLESLESLDRYSLKEKQFEYNFHDNEKLFSDKIEDHFPKFEKLDYEQFHFHDFYSHSCELSSDVFYC